MPSATMGNAGAKGAKDAKVQKAPWRRKKNVTSLEEKKKDDEWIVAPDSDLENQRFLEMKRLVREEPNVFILNNLVMTLQLFTNFDKEMEKARESVASREEELNRKLIPEKHVLMPDILREHFKGKIRFTSYAKDEQTVEPLRPVQIYLVYGNVIVTEIEDSRDYSTTGDVSVEYTFVLKEADHKGYVRLEQPTKSMTKRTANSDTADLSSIAENRNEIYSEDESVYGPLPVKRLNSSSSMPNLLDKNLYYDGRNSNPTYDFQSDAGNCSPKNNGRLARKRSSTILHFRNQQSSASSSSSGYTTNCSIDSDNESYLSQSRLHYLANGKRVDPSEIPDRCFKCVTYMFNGRVYNPRKEQRPLTSQQRRIREEKLAYNYDVVYVNGHRFAKHFYEVFKSQLADKMNFDEKDVLNAKRCDATVRLEKIDYLNTKNYINIEPYEVIPCFATHWPQWARRWMTRSRGNWPTEEALEQIGRYHCYLVPESLKQALPNSDLSHPLWQLDWYLMFPRAEKYLETCLSPAQTTVYTIALMIHKIFIRTVSSTFGLEVRHIRNILFWMVEKQPDWSEHELGKSMVILLERLHKHVQLRKMSDYFMDDSNIFANVNTDGLLHSQKQLKRIIDNPVMFVFHAMEKIHYESDDYYPRLDYKKLLNVLTVNELLLISPALANHLQDEIYKKPSADRKFWNQAKQTNQYYMQTRKRSIDTFFINPRRISDTIIEIQEKCEPLTNIRLAHLSMFFAEYFLEMAQCCQNYSDAHQKRVYLDQAKLLALLLFENPKYKQHARNLAEKINSLRVVGVIVKPTNLGPETPKRNADQPIFIGSLKNRYTHDRRNIVTEENETNNNNLTEIEIHTGQKSVLKKTKSDVA
ncbi:uncharacterized protein LOC131664651 [Phymastichus coffea]|uniref:uncharacterized protein LOC131664651 n=1 Tax=Phymastichus coffea TaxID=108790 RepID=UPI00273ACCB0|nr:uncharacterized protein LOC131664651 [Phymastichus coffea]